MRRCPPYPTLSHLNPTRHTTRHPTTPHLTTPHQVGIVLISCLLSAYTFSMVGRTVEVTGATDFRDLWSLTLGAKSAWIVDFMIMGEAT